MEIKRFLLSSMMALGVISAPVIARGQDEAADSSGDVTTPSDSRPTQAELGIGVAPLPSVLTSHLPDVIGKGRGVLVANVTAGSPADQAGLKKHDVLIRYGDQDLYSPEQLVKRVRNDRPGKEVEVQYVRGGKIATAKVTLGEKSRQPPVQSNWPGFIRPFDVPMPPFRPDFLTEDQDLLGQGTEWTRFQSMSVSKDPDGTYRAAVKYKDEDGDTIEREYSGTRQEVRAAIEADRELPASQKEQLLRSLDDRGRITLPDLDLPSLPRWSPWSRELFNWPDVTF